MTDDPKCVDPDAPIVTCAYCEAEIHTCALAEGDPRVGGWQEPGTSLPGIEALVGQCIGVDDGHTSHTVIPDARGTRWVGASYVLTPHKALPKVIGLRWRWTVYNGESVSIAPDYTCPAHPEGVCVNEDTYHDEPPPKRWYCGGTCHAAHVAEWRLKLAHKILDDLGIARETWDTDDWHAGSPFGQQVRKGDRLYCKDVEGPWTWDDGTIGKPPIQVSTPRWVPPFTITPEAGSYPCRPWRIERRGEGTPIPLERRIGLLEVAGTGAVLEMSKEAELAQEEARKARAQLDAAHKILDDRTEVPHRNTQGDPFSLRARIAFTLEARDSRYAASVRSRQALDAELNDHRQRTGEIALALAGRAVGRHADGSSPDPMAVIVQELVAIVEKKAALVVVAHQVAQALIVRAVKAGEAHIVDKS